MRLAALAACALACACGRSRPKSTGEPVQRLSGLSMSQTFQGQKVWELAGQEAALTDEERQASVQGPKMTFYRDGKAASTLVAKTGQFRLDSRDVLLSSSVVVTSLDDRSTLKTEELRFLADRRKFFTDKEVLVDRPGAKLRGSGLEATPDLSEIRVFNQRSVIEKGGVPE